MKMKLWFLSAVAVLISASAFPAQKGVGKNEIVTNLMLKNNNQVTISLRNIEGKTVGFEVFSDEGEKVWEGSIKGKKRGSFSHNLNYLDEGLYTYQVKDGEKVVYSVKVLKDNEKGLELRCADNEICTAIIPLAPDNHLVEIRMHKPQKSTATILVSDESGEIISIKNMKCGKDIVLKYDLTFFPSGNYVISVYDGKMLSGYRKINL